jgi:HD-GYP domain-containing protein (c-di-GMP phosphodiesterase class II)/type II secretory pathway pseudopilin PulG
MAHDASGMPVPGKRTVMALAILILVIAVTGFVLMARLVEDNKTRELDAAYRQLGLVADSRAAAVDEWLGTQKKAISAMAGNPSLSFFMTELQWSGDVSAVTDGESRLQILKNYLLFSADQTGFTAPPEGADVPANIDRKARAGLMVIDSAGRPVVGTPWTPDVIKRLGDLDALVTRKAPLLVGPYPGETGEASLILAAPIMPFEGGSAKGGGAVGFVIGVRLIGDDLAARLRQPGEQTETGRNYLVGQKGGQKGDQIQYLAGVRDDAVAAPLPNTPEKLAAAFAAASPGAYAIRDDYAGTRVLVTGEVLSEAPWTLVRTVAAEEALGGAEARARSLLIIFGLVVLSLVIGILLIWRHGASVRVAAAAARQQALANRLERLTGFLRAVTDSQPTAIAALDEAGHYRFANRRSAEDGAMEPADMMGKTITSVLGAARGRGLDADNRAVIETGEPVTRIRSHEGEDGEKILKTFHTPIEIPDGIGGGDGGQGVLMVLEDVTALVTERERREHTLRQLVTTLATIIDSRDPFATRHSRMVAEVAEAVAEDMDLDDVTVETAEIAGALMNLGKVLVPREVLTREGDLTSGELETIRSSILASAELLKGVAFDGPVVETIRQVQAHWDGSGIPAGLKGEDILITARIVAVANAFVGMISPRAYRQGLPMDDVIRLLLEKVDTVFDRRPVAALVNYLDNHGGREKWERRPGDRIDPADPA